jgi:hypothetical protein
MKGYLVVIGLCSFLAGVSYILACVGIWWSNGKDFWTIDMTLWNVHLEGKITAVGASLKETVSFEDFCDPSKVYSMKDTAWCDEALTKIKAARGTSILACIFAWTTLGFLLGGSKIDNPQIMSVGGGISGVLCLIMAITAIGVGAWFPEESALDTPNWGFVFVVVGAFFSLIAVGTAVTGVLLSQFSTGFSGLDGGSSWGGWKPDRKQVGTPPVVPQSGSLMQSPASLMPVHRPVVMMPPPPSSMGAPMSGAPMSRGGDFGIGPHSTPSVMPNPLTPSMPPLPPASFVPVSGASFVPASGGDFRPSGGDFRPSGGDFGMDAPISGFPMSGFDFGIDGQSSLAPPMALATRSVKNGPSEFAAYRAGPKDFGLDRE